MAENKLLDLLKIVILLGIFTLLLLKVLWEANVSHPVPELSAVAVDALPAVSDFDPSYMLDLMAESGNLKPHRELDDALLKTRKILLTNDVNVNSTKFVVASLILLNEADKNAPIDLYVRTNGGYYDDAFAVVDMMRSIDAPVNTYAVGGCHSSGAVIVASGTGTRSAYANALLMVHDNLSKADGKYSADAKENERLRIFWSRYEQLPQSWFSKNGDKRNYITAKEALAFELVDQIVSD